LIYLKNAKTKTKKEKQAREIIFAIYMGVYLSSFTFSLSPCMGVSLNYLKETKLHLF
jgi:hypothetical protein